MKKKYFQDINWASQIYSKISEEKAFFPAPHLSLIKIIIKFLHLFLIFSGLRIPKGIFKSKKI